MISVIVPIYNVAAHLEKCLQSVCGQTYRDMEIILVNDGSTDGSPEICEEYKKRDDRIKVVNKQNGGLVSARQAGILAASGDLIGWVDGDDWVERDYFQQMVTTQNESGVDIVASALFSDIGNESHKITNNIPPGTYSCDTLLPQLLYAGTFFEYGLQPHLVTKLCRKQLLEQKIMQVDPRICGGEDAAVVYPSVLIAKTIKIADFCGYHYVKRPGSLTHVEKRDEEDSLRLLMEHLERCFTQSVVPEVLLPQLKQYRKYLYSLRYMHAFDPPVLRPYGGIPLHSRVVIYGAGALGQQMYRYLIQYKYANVLLWVDRNAAYYQQNGMEIHLPETIETLDRQYDYVLIANTVETIADEIRKYLLFLQIPNEKIRWFSKEFIRE